MRKGQSTVRHKPEPMRRAMPAYAHSLHPHGFVFAATSNGAYPLSPPDPSQPIPAAEQAAWTAVGGVTGNKRGNRVPPGGTFTYTWETFGWQTTTGAWLYHDHSIWWSIRTTPTNHGKCVADRLRLESCG